MLFRFIMFSERFQQRFRTLVGSARYQEYEELERDMPGIDSSGVEQHFQPTESLWNF